MLKPVLKFALDLLFPVVCQNCGAEGEYLCASCAAGTLPPLSRCIVCGHDSPEGRVHDACGSRDTALHGLMVASEYKNEAVRRLIWHLKFNSVRSIAPSLARLLADHLVKIDVLDYFTAAAVIPVPMHWRRQRNRSYNQAELIAKEFARMLRLDYCPILQKVRSTKSQVDLPRQERIENIRGSFAAATLPSLGERKILLIDDVATTGATLNECARELKKQGASEIWGLVVARN